MVDDVVSRGTDDWVDVCEVSTRVRANAARYGFTLSVDAQLDVALEVIRRVLDAGYMVAGETPGGGRGFVSWELDPSASYECIEREWRAYEHPEEINISEVCWLSNTPLGNEHGLAVRDEVNRRFTWPHRK